MLALSMFHVRSRERELSPLTPTVNFFFGNTSLLLCGISNIADLAFLICERNPKIQLILFQTITVNLKCKHRFYFQQFSILKINQQTNKYKKKKKKRAWSWKVKSVHILCTEQEHNKVFNACVYLNLPGRLGLSVKSLWSWLLHTQGTHSDIQATWERYHVLVSWIHLANVYIVPAKFCREEKVVTRTFNASSKNW